MPLYNYICPDCSKEQSHILKVDDRKIPEETPCPECGGTKVHQLIGAPNIVSGVSTNIRPDDAFRDIMKEMKKAVPHNNINVE
jgi:putative FmdB family regulatory protein